MNVVVTGGAGYIGSVCVEALCAAGHDVTVVDNLSEGHRAAVDPRARLVVLDLADRAGLNGLLNSSRPAAVVHFAASALVGESMRDPSLYFRNNVLSGLNLADAAVASGVRRFVFSSSCATYGTPEQVPMDESQPQRPINPYGESKWMFERILHWYGQIHGLEPVILRYFNAAGATRRCGEHHRVETHLIPNILRVALGQTAQVEVYGTDYPTPDGTCIRDYVHVADLAEAHRLALEPGRVGAFNLGTGTGASVREVIAACERVSGRPIAVRTMPRRAGDPPRLVAAADKAYRELGWRPKFTLIEDVVATAWDWHRRHPEGYPD
ncbi:MAG: UDP-glucose 4-epimerase GalE [Verrucomicrobiae bacterium]|nr:UDP-glucose 4-epimerase GalE [Verrucomicrobiae bacterium]